MSSISNSGFALKGNNPICNIIFYNFNISVKKIPLFSCFYINFVIFTNFLINFPLTCASFLCTFS